MSPAGAFPVLVASDGSPQARDAVAVAVAFPWPRGARASGVLAREVIPVRLPRDHGGELESTLTVVAQETRKALLARWSRPEVSLVKGAAASAIMAEARRCRARVIVVGARGHSAVSRLLLGSVSRSVVRAARCSVLVARGTPGRIRSVVVGVDGSAQARRALDLVARLVPSRGARAAVVRVLEPIHIPSLGLLPAGVRGALRSEAAALHARRLRAAEREMAAAVRLLRPRWQASAVIRIGTPVHELLRSAREVQADLIVVGARGIGGVERLLLGSVADAIVEQSPVSVLVAR